MENGTVTYAKLGFAGVASAIAGFFGGWDVWLTALITFTCLDFVLGIIKAVVAKEMSSQVMWLGGLKKILIYVVVAVAVIVDKIIVPEGGAMFRTLAIGYYIATEGLSVLENIAQLGVPLPPKLMGVLKQLKDKNDGGAGS